MTRDTVLPLPDELLDLLRGTATCYLTTVMPDGSPQVTQTWSDTDGHDVLINTVLGHQKVRNVRRDPRVSMCLLSDDWNDAWVQVDGTGEVLDMPEAVEDFVTYFRSISGEHPDWDEYRAAMQKQGKSLIRITVERWGPIATGGFPARLTDGA